MNNCPWKQPGHQPSFTRHSPPWWPENEPWPPGPPHTRLARRKFFRRVGCLFLLISLLMGFFFSVVFWVLARQAGFVHSPTPRIWVGPLFGLAILFGISSLIWAGRRLRWMSAPFGDLLEASEQVAAGNYTARVKEEGPAEVRSLGHAFNHMADRLQTTDEQRRRLLADISHELRTPLTVVQGNLEGLLDGIYPPDEAHLKSIFEETQVLARLVEDLHTLALAESGALQLRLEPVELAALVGETAAAFGAQADAAGITLEVQIDPNLPGLSLDPQRMHQVLSNLIANALRYTPSGGKVSILGRAVPVDGETHVLLEVTDTGPGISEADLPYVFDRFYKSRDSGGSGLGLAIARRLVEAQGGSIEAISPPGEGTTIKIRLPV